MITGYISRYVIHMAIAVTIYIPCRLIFIKRKNRKVQLRHELWLLLFWIFVIGILSQTVFPRIHMGITDSGKFYIDTYYPPRTAPNFIPFKTLRLFWANRHTVGWTSVSLLNILGNLLLFIPIGFLFPLAFPKRSQIKYVFSYMLIGILGIEFLQYFCGRVADIDDVFLNMIGILLGYGIFTIYKTRSVYKMKQKMSRKFTTFFAILLLVSVLVTNPLQVTAATPPNSTAEPYSQNKPGECWNLANDGVYWFSGYANQSDLYSNYYFTGASKVEIYVENQHATKELTVKLLKQQTGVDFSVSTEKIPAGEYKKWSVSIDSSRNYILKFYAPSDFEGYISIP